jgi:hypothetical protein
MKLSTEKYFDGQSIQNTTSMMNKLAVFNFAWPFKIISAAKKPVTMFTFKNLKGFSEITCNHGFS